MTPQGPLAGRATATDRPLPAGWFSTAARRTLRVGPARTSLAGDDARDPTALVAAANRCPLPEPFMTPGLPPRSPFDRGALEKHLAAFRHDPQVDRRSIRVVLERLAAAGVDAATLRVLQRELETLASGQSERGGEGPMVDLLRSLTQPEPTPDPCEPVNLEALAAGARQAFDPRREDAAARRQVLDVITGVDSDRPLAPPEFCPGLDVPVWEWLENTAGTWMLPGRGTVPNDAVLPSETNAIFTDALLVGLNTQVLHELRWRNLRVAAGCTPVRTFWNRIDADGVEGDPGQRLDDIHGVANWSAGGPLGDPSHGPPAATGGDLVLVVRGQLLLRYPATLVYLVPDDDGDPQFGEAAEFPTFRGRLGDDTTFLGFQGVAATELAAWWVVFEESPSGFQFRSPVPAGLTPLPDGAGTADLLFAQPVRVLLRGTDLVVDA
jgi:hypothetical protein